MTDDPHRAFLEQAQPDIRVRLEAIQKAVEQAVPAAARTSGYGMPAYRDERIFIYFSGFSKHIGIYPPVHGPAELVADLEPFRGPRGNLAFAHVEPLPVWLVARVAAALHARYGA